MAHYDSPRFPEKISYGAAGGPEYRTQVVQMASGFEVRNQNWSVARMSWDVAHGLKNQTDLDELLAFFRGTAKGKANSFRFKDWGDFSASYLQGRLGVIGQTGVFYLAGTGSGTPSYQLGKRYLSGSQYEDRETKKIVAASYTIYRNYPTTVTEGGAAGNFSIDIDTGIVSFVADASSAATGITPGTTTQVILSTNPGTLIAGQLLYLSGFTGADAAFVNGLAHTINSVTGTGPYTFTLATNTSGKTITVGAGTGYKYPQVTDLLTSAFQFDIPCRFDTDHMKIDIEGYNVYNWGQIPVVEVRL